MKRKDEYSQRFRLAYGAASATAAALAVAWGAFFTYLQAWPVVAMTVAVVLVSISSFVIARRRDISIALLFSQVAFLLLIIVFCLIFDVPSPGAPRVTHVFLLVLALLGYIGYRRDHSRLQLSIVVLCLATFVVFASTNAAPAFATPLSEAIRIHGAWINTTVAVIMLAAGVHFIQLEIIRTLGDVRDIKSALQNEEFELFYQPQVDENGGLTGAEGLIRWKKADGDYIPPADFIPLAEQAGLMPGIGSWVVLEACKTLALWQQEEATRRLMLSVNVSVDQFMKPDFVVSVLSRIEALKVDATKLKLELTESMMVTDVEPVVEKMRLLHATGITLSLDDFGTGYASLSYLRQLPIQEIKIDRSFVKDAPDNKRNRLLLKSIFDIADTLELSVIAEGIETKEQLGLLRSLGCTRFQGYYFGKPLPLQTWHERWTLEPSPA